MDMFLTPVSKVVAHLRLDQESRAWKAGVAISIMGAALALRLYQLGAQSLWFDETYTVLVARMPVKLGLDFLVADGVHPPLFYWIEKVVLSLGESDWLVRLPAMIFGVLGVLVLYLFTERWIGRRVGLVSALLLAASPFHIWYSQEARMYSLLALLALISMWGYLQILNKPPRRHYVIFALSSALAYLTHYFALFLPLIQFLHLLVHLRRYPRQLRIWSGLQAAASVPLLGWIYLLAQRPVQHFGIGWIPNPVWKDLIYSLANFTIGYIPPVRVVQWLLVAGISALVAWGVKQIGDNAPLRTLLLLWAFFPPLLILLLSIRRPTYGDRFFILCLPAFLILLSAGIVALRKKWAVAAGLVTLSIFAWRSIAFLNPPDTLLKEDWRQAVRYVSAELQDNEIIVPRLLQGAVPFLYYQTTDLPFRAMEVNREVTSLTEITRGYRGAWLVYWNASQAAHAFASQQKFDPTQEVDPMAAAWITGHGPRILERHDFVGVTIFHFALSPQD
jgi:mannosyltransferase